MTLLAHLVETSLRVGAASGRLVKIRELAAFLRGLAPDEIETGEWFTPDAVTKWVREKPQDFASCFVLLWNRLISSSSLSR